MPSIPRIDPAAIARTRDGRLVSTKNPEGHDAAWWCRSLDAGQVLAKARADHGDVALAARQLGVKTIEHSAAVQRAQDCVRRLDARIATAQRAGDLGFFNRTYKLRRRQAQAEGRPFPPYTAAKARLRRALVGIAAGDRPSVIARVFEDRPPDPQ
jgi:hypothetical protein